MDYEQKYKHALDLAKQVHDTTISKQQKENIEIIFPELKENWDEMIRKNIISLVNAHGQGRFKESVLDWLEKQGTSYTKRDVDDAYVEGMAFAKDELEKQKPTEWKQENREELTEFENAMMHIGGSFFGENAGLDPNDTDTIKEQAELLLELAPKTEWSEEDEKMIDLIISVLEVNHSKGIFKVGLRAIRTREIVYWLKSLKQRYTWKPSKEQMDAMQMAVSYFDYSWISKEQKLLESLYKDLKKLTEE